MKFKHSGIDYSKVRMCSLYAALILISIVITIFMGSSTTNKSIDINIYEQTSTTTMITNIISSINATSSAKPTTSAITTTSTSSTVETSDSNPSASYTDATEVIVEEVDLTTEICVEIITECTESSTDIELIEPVTNAETILGTYQATWYTAVDMGYTSPPYGASGRTLESGYSIASNSIPFGTIVKVSGGGLDGIYRVDDCGGMANNVIDFYYWDRSCVPYQFLQSGRVSITISICQ